VRVTAGAQHVGTFQKTEISQRHLSDYVTGAVIPIDGGLVRG